MSKFFKAAGIGNSSPCRKRAINYVDCTVAPPSENVGDRYILDATTGTVHAGWDGASKRDVVTFGGTLWAKETPEEGWMVYLTTPDYYRYFTIGEWEIWEDGSAAVAAHCITYDHTKIHDIATAGTGISIIGQAITNSDTGSGAVSAHNLAYDHTKIHDIATAGTGISILGQAITNSDLGSTAVSGHNLAFTHSDIALNTGARHAQSHALDSGSDHTGTLAASQLPTGGNWALASNLVINSGAGDYDFTIKKLTSGDAYAYDAGADTHLFGGTSVAVTRSSASQQIMSVKAVTGSITPTTAGVKGEFGLHDSDGYLYFWRDTSNVVRFTPETTW